nr:MAG TPA: hypothetical protein [Caudoviricetes sp.]
MQNYIISWIEFLNLRCGQSAKNYTMLFHGLKLSNTI